MTTARTIEAATVPRSTHRFPFSVGTLRMGLSPIPEAEWLEFGPDCAEQMRAKEALLAERLDAVLQVLPGSEASSAEALDVVEGWLRQHEPARVVATTARHPLARAAQLVQEDLCILERGGDGYRLTAGCVCFPSNWSLREKLGLPVQAIHGPVPGYDPALAAPVDRLFDRLAAGQIVMRHNWLIHDTAELHQVDRVPDDRPIARDEAGERLWLRVERQTLRRLPAGRAVLFTIRTRVERLDAAITRPDAAKALGDALRAMTPALWSYRRMDRIGPPLFAWLDRRARESSPTGS